MAKADFTYIVSNGFYSIFPETEAARHTVRAMLEGSPAGNKLLKFEFESFRKQARAAGYTVRKARDTGISGDDLLDALGE